MMEKPTDRPKSTGEKIMDWVKISTLIGASFISGKVAVEAYKDYEKDREYKNYVEYSMTQQEKDRLNEYFEQIKKHFGQEAIDEINFGDKIAYFERKENISKTAEYIGFNQLGLDSELVKKFISEKIFFPKKWIDGEIARFVYIDDHTTGPLGIGIGLGAFNPNSNTILIFKKIDFDSNSMDKSNFLWYLKYICAHETAHANNWETDNESSLLDRAELLKGILYRLQAEDKYISNEAKRGHGEYFSSKINAYEVAHEYWAEICKAYFSDPAELQELHPKDFDLVHNFVLRQDPNFNAFKVGGPYFDSKTGELLEKWRSFDEAVAVAK